jgi:nucleotide-binding universal stress UspA family protein
VGAERGGTRAAGTAIAVLGHERSTLPVLWHVPGLPDEVERVAKRIVGRWDEDGAALESLVQLDFHVGDPAETLAEVAERANAAMIVVGHRRERALTRFRSSVAQDLIRMSACPVVVVP